MELDDGRSRGVENGKGSRAWRLGATFSLRVYPIVDRDHRYSGGVGPSDHCISVWEGGEHLQAARSGVEHRSNGAYGPTGPGGRQVFVGPIIRVAVTQEVGDDGGVAPRRRGGCESSGDIPCRICGSGS
ncbi:hypothetical protein U1Q18_023829 [Sarracenia purpurea var. burkii]